MTSEAAPAAALLEIARDTLRAELAPVLDPGHRYTAAMIANAMAIAARTLRDAGAAEAAEDRALRLVLGGAPDRDLTDLRRELVAEIRAGRFDGQADHHLRPSLRARVDARLAISSPDYKG